MAVETFRQKSLLAIISMIAAIGGLLFGYDTGVISGAILYIKEEFLITRREEEVIIAVLSLGAVIGAFFGGSLSDYFGRKKVVLCGSIFFIISAIGLALSNSVRELVIWRIIIGLAIGISSATAPLYIAELSPRFMRGALVSLNQLSITIGILISYLVGLFFVDSKSWRLMFAVAAIPAAIQLLVMSCFPESPRYLTKIGNTKKALNVLTRFRGSRRDAELEISHIEKASQKKRGNWKELFQRAVRPALLAGVGVTVIQQITGINTIIYYAPTIFKFGGFSSDQSALYATAWVGLINVLMTFVAIYLLDKVGRKPLLFFGLAGMVTSLSVLGLWFYVADISQTGMRLVPLICLFVYIGSFAYSLGPVGWLLNSEIYPLHLRGMAMSIAVCANWLSNFFITWTFLDFVNYLGKGGTFWLYAAIGMAGIFFIWRRVPETKGKSLEEIEDFWKKKVPNS